jgi:outer membrane protein TolC
VKRPGRGPDRRPPSGVITTLATAALLTVWLAALPAAAPADAPSDAPSDARPTHGRATRVTAADTVYVGLDEMVHIAMTNNLTLQAAAAAAREAQTFARATRSRFDPVLSLGGDSNTDGIGGQLAGLVPTGARYLLGSVAPTVIPGEPVFPNALVASVTQPLLRDIGFQSVRYSIRAVDEAVAAARARLDRTRLEVTAAIGIAYARLVERHRQEAIATRSVQRAEELRSAYQELRALDRITEIDLITAQQGVASRRATLLETRRDRRNAEDDLVFAVYGARAATMLAGEQRVLIPRDTIVAVPQRLPIDSAVQRALASRTDLAAARHEAERARWTARQARNALLPSLNVTGAFTSTITDPPAGSTRPGGDNRVQDWALGVVFSRPLRNAASSADRARALAAEARADILVTDAENQVRAEVRAAHRDLMLGEEQVALATEASQLARRQYTGERERLTLGLTEIFRVLQYEEQVARVERVEAQAWLAFAVSVERYHLALGEAR